MLGMKDYNRRKFCSMPCYGKAQWKAPDSPQKGRYQAQRLVLAKTCSECGKPGPRLHRHHIDGDARNNRLENILVLCAKCHYRKHRPPPPMSICAVCDKEFLAACHRNRPKICSAQCAKEWGRICAMKRWSRGQCDCAVTATASVALRRKRSSKAILKLKEAKLG